MAVSNRRDKKQVPDLTIFEEQKKAKISARKTLEIAKAQETEKLNQGYSYIVSADGKTRVLTKINKT